MKIKLIMTGLTLFCFIGCFTAKKKQLASVSFDYTVQSINYRLVVKVEKNGDRFNGTYQEKLMQKSETFTFTEADFDKLTKIIMKIGKPSKKHRYPITDENREGTFTVVFNDNIERTYDVGKFSDKQETNLKNEAIDLIKKWIDRHKQKSEIRISWYRTIPPTSEVCIHLEPADLVVYLGEFVEHRNQKENMSGGSESGTYRWKALKPGVVTVWREELNGYFKEEKISEEFEPYRCYIIDENLNVYYSEEETEVAKKKFRQKLQQKERLFNNENNNLSFIDSFASGFI